MSYDRWYEDYARKLMPAEEAARLVSSGDAIAIPVGAVVPRVASAIVKRAGDLENVDVYVQSPRGDPGWFEPGHEALRMHVEMFSNAVSRPAIARGSADFTSVPFCLRFKPDDERARPVHPADVVLISVSPPDHVGFCSLGLSVWNAASFVERARTVIAEVHADYPRTCGDSQVHVSQIHAFVEADPSQSWTVPAPPAADCPAEIAAFVNELVNDGDTIQVGLGGVTNGLPLAGAFEGKSDLGAHTELSAPGMTRLVRDGVINGHRKSLHRGKYVAAQLEASAEGDIEFVDGNPIFQLRDVGYVNDPRVIGQNDHMVAINNALAIDFAGQITAESIDGELWSGPGGQQDFAIGALFSRGGRNITVLRATAMDGTKSRILPRLPAGTVVTVPRQYADYVVTEFGIASLFGKSDRERAEELISIAHPDHRSELRKALQRA